MNFNPFMLAQPVWAENRVQEKNCQLGFSCSLRGEGKTVQVLLATAGWYFLFLDGVFLSFGPARAAKDYFRVDTVQVSLPEQPCRLAILAVNPGICSFGLQRQDAFLQAEVRCGDKILAATGIADMDFTCLHLTERVQKVQRYSYQRPFAEGYRLRPDYRDWMFGKPCGNAEPCRLERQTAKTLLPRRLQQAEFPLTAAEQVIAHGNYILQTPQTLFRDRSYLYATSEPTDKYLEGYPPSELEWQLSDEAQQFATTELHHEPAPLEQTVSDGHFCIYAWHGEYSGFLSLRFRCQTAGTLYLLFDELLNAQKDVDPMRLCCCNVIRLDCEPGDYCFQSRECYAMRYCKVLSLGGTFALDSVQLCRVQCPQPITQNYHSKNPKTEAILQAAKETFLQNSADIFMDCPSRERAGWLCDSFFLGRSEYEFTGQNAVERNFLENYGLAKGFGEIPRGMVAMCYPSDQTPEGFIPNWAMWLLLELTEYCGRTKDRSMAELFAPRVRALLDWFAGYENRDGLLEKLPGWVFVEWSKANDFVQDVNYPTNMLYGYMLQKIGALYEQNDLIQKGGRLLQTVREKSFDGVFFTDNAICGADGIAVNTGNCTETCQYYAFFTGTATPQTYPALWDILTHDFGPERKKLGGYPHIFPSNAFIGNYLRMMLLVRYGCYRQMLEESVDYFYYMAGRTGTLWEYAEDFASCNHGFASYVAYLIRIAEQMEGQTQ